SGITPSSVILSVNPATGNMAAGVYNSVVTFTSNNVATRQLPVTFNLVKPTLLPSATTITLGGPYGRDFSPQTWSLSLNTSTNTWPFTLSTVPSWVVVTPPSSLTVNKAPVNIVLTPDPTAVTAGISNAVLQATANVNGDAPTAGTLITINRDVHKLLPAETAVALSGTPGGARISRTIAVTDNFALGTAWTAASDQPWLTVTTTAGSLTMTADPTSLGVNTLNTANVAITPASADVAMPETIRVAFWKGSSAPTASTPLSLPYTNIVADPVRPLLYAHNGGAFIDVYNVYTQQKLSTITGFSAALGDMVVSPNGDHLYLIDINNHTLMTVDLNNLGITAQWPLPNSVSKSTRLRAIRPNGVEMVVLSDGTVWLATTGGRLPSIALAGGSLDATRDGKHLYQQDEGKSTVNLTTFSIDYAALAGGTLFAAKQASGSHAATGSQGQDLAASPDGSRIYTASTNPASCSALNPADLSIQYYLPSGNNPPNNVEVGSDGRVYCGVAGRNAAADVWVFSATGAPLKQIKFAAPGEQLAPRQMVISGDGFLLIGLTDAGTVDVVPIGP
ncbi:MAG: quinoprotein amine dehydrogenase, partial [Paucibacter sp.]|nr:quinoprotein amine dehydrogenase [Roseateles sp.]